MIHKQFRFPIVVFIMCILFINYSCNNKNVKDIPNPVFYKNINIAEQKLTESNYQSAFYYYFKAKESCSENEKDRMVYALNEMAEIQRKQCDFYGCEATTTEALENCKNPKYLNRIYNTFGLSYLEQNDYKSSLKYYNLFYKNCKSENDKLITANNIGYLYLESNQYKKAIAVLKPLIDHDTLLNIPSTQARILDNLGYAYFKENDSNAIIYLNKALDIREKNENTFDKIASYIHLSEYHQNKDGLVAKNYASKAYTTATKENSVDDRLEALQFLIINSNPIEVKNLAIKQFQLSDSINKVRKMARNEFAKIKYDSTKAIAEKEMFKKQKENIFLVLLFVSIISILSYFLIRIKNKTKLLQNTYNTETRISKKLHDELANDVYHTLTFVETQNLQNPETKESLLNNLEKIYNRTRNISNENSSIDTGENYPQILRELISNYNSNDTKIIINNFSETDWKKINKEKKIIIYRVINELLVNMKKHSQCSIAVLSFKSTFKLLEITYSDDGKGCTKSRFLKNGLQNVENRINSIKGTITFDINKGFKSKISLPI